MHVPEPEPAELGGAFDDEARAIAMSLADVELEAAEEPPGRSPLSAEEEAEDDLAAAARALELSGEAAALEAELAAAIASSS